MPNIYDINFVSTKILNSEIPYQRYGHTVVAYKGKVYLWGGRSDQFRTSSILHEFDPGND